jgi:hypothetical protein
VLACRFALFDVDVIIFNLHVFYSCCLVCYVGIIDCFQWFLQKEDQQVSQVIIMAMVNISVNVKCREKMGRSGIFSYLIPALNKSSIETTRQWCMLINNLSANSLDNKTLLGAEGICEQVVHIMHEFIKSKSVCLQAVSALKNLAAAAENTVHIYSADGCEVIHLVLCEYGHSMFSIIEKLATAVELMVAPPENVYIIDRLHDLNVISTMHACLQSYRSHRDASSEVIPKAPHESVRSKTELASCSTLTQSNYEQKAAYSAASSINSAESGRKRDQFESVLNNHLRVYTELLQQQQNSSFN